MGWADLSNADPGAVDFSGTDARETAFDGARMYGVRAVGADFPEALFQNRGAHWTLRAGDFRVRAGPVSRRGGGTWLGRPTAGRERSTGGRLTAFRVSTGQRLCGASVTLGLGEAWTVGARLLRLDGEPQDRRGVWNAPAPLRFRAATTAAAWAAYRSDGLRLFFEAAAAGSKPAGPGGVAGRRFHGTAAAKWSRPRAGAVLVAESQGADYLPAAGAYLGDRATGRASARPRPLRGLCGASRSEQVRFVQPTARVRVCQHWQHR